MPTCYYPDCCEEAAVKLADEDGGPLHLCSAHARRHMLLTADDDPSPLTGYNEGQFAAAMAAPSRHNLSSALFFESMLQIALHEQTEKQASGLLCYMISLWTLAVARGDEAAGRAHLQSMVDSVIHNLNHNGAYLQNQLDRAASVRKNGGLKH